MQIIRAIAVSPDQYANEGFHQRIEAPNACPHCNAQKTFSALGYYSRNLTSAERGVLRIFVRRFRCRSCGRTVSILPSFAQPYRLVLNRTITDFFNGVLNTDALRWLSLLKQYWNRFSKWLPRIGRTIEYVVERSPPARDAAGWWQLIVAKFHGLEAITTTLVSGFGLTLFARYRCHSPCAIIN